MRRHRHDRGNARLVVGAEKRRAVGEDDVLARVAEDFGKLSDGKDDVLLCVEHDVPARHADDLRRDARAGRIGRGVHVGDHADRGTILKAGRGGNRTVDDARVGEERLESESAKLLEQFGRKRKLLSG